MAATESTLITPNPAVLDYHSLNAMLNLYDADGNIQFEKDKEATRQYYLQHVLPNTVKFDSVGERLQYLVSEGYYEADVLNAYPFEFVSSLLSRHINAVSASRPSLARGSFIPATR